MQPSRRDFLRAGVGSSTLLACGLSVPTFLARTANALAASSARTAACSSSCNWTAATTV
jgi:hypothetical protein